MNEYSVDDRVSRLKYEIESLNKEIAEARREVNEHRWHVSQIMKRESQTRQELAAAIREREQAEMQADALAAELYSAQREIRERQHKEMRLAKAIRERDEARAWARHYYWWSGFLSELVSVWSKKWYADFRKKGGSK